QLPGELREHLVLLVGLRMLRVRAWLTGVVPEVLVAREEPQAIADNRTAEVGGEVPIPCALISTFQRAGTWIGESDRLARQAGRLSVVGRVVEKPVAALSRDHVDDGALHVAELGRRPDRLDVHFLNEVDAWLRSRDAV